jgi:hypothetical protein
MSCLQFSFGGGSKRGTKQPLSSVSIWSMNLEVDGGSTGGKEVPGQQSSEVTRTRSPRD